MSKTVFNIIKTKKDSKQFGGIITPPPPPWLQSSQTSQKRVSKQKDTSSHSIQHINRLCFTIGPYNDDSKLEEQLKYLDKKIISIEKEDNFS